MNRLLRPMKNCPRNDDHGGAVKHEEGLLVELRGGWKFETQSLQTKPDRNGKHASRFFAGSGFVMKGRAALPKRPLYLLSKIKKCQVLSGMKNNGKNIHRDIGIIEKACLNAIKGCFKAANFYLTIA